MLLEKASRSTHRHTLQLPPYNNSKDHDTHSAMTTVKATADWNRVGDKYYRKTQLYTSIFDGDLELENHTLVQAPYSGAIGMQTPASKKYGAD